MRTRTPSNKQIIKRFPPKSFQNNHRCSRRIITAARVKHIRDARCRRRQTRTVRSNGVPVLGNVQSQMPSQTHQPDVAELDVMRVFLRALQQAVDRLERRILGSSIGPMQLTGLSEIGDLMDTSP
ncbi:hypothetical protein K435DRAFT_967813 [Dendrothele bispora CBS 962.96]|uniref:Uncharacterized protein n=1 Tax=Dendrothele bispora (strain CBS 962.96) TaxID=1314807 RepID=A0A4S8LT35_DENBC|nr:hypothetical protein K435DRAFT_967813 [Dendrothele bispora CBS 962.96]